MISRTTKTIGGRVVEIARCAATEALDLELSLNRVGTPQNLTHAELIRLMNLVFKYMTIDGKPFRDIDEDFSDRPRDIWEAFTAAIDHNVSPLGDGLPLKSQPTSPSPTK